MPEPLYGLTANEVRALRALAQREINQRRTTEQRTELPDYEIDTGQQTEMYVFKTPPDGIPALAYDSADEVTKPGHALCEVYRISWEQRVEDYVLKQTVSPDRLVFNLAEDAVPGDTYVTADRDKFGKWVVGGGGGPSGSKLVNLCVVRSGGYVTEIRATWMDENDVLTCEPVPECPACDDDDETGTDDDLTGTAGPCEGECLVMVGFSQTHGGAVPLGEIAVDITVDGSTVASGSTNLAGYVSMSVACGSQFYVTVTPPSGCTASWSVNGASPTAGSTAGPFTLEVCQYMYLVVYLNCEATGTGSELTGTGGTGTGPIGD